jgi:hypothetical protein
VVLSRALRATFRQSIRTGRMTRDGVGVYAPSGCRQRNPSKRATSLSVVMSSQPCSIASAAKQASGTKGPSIPLHSFRKRSQSVRLRVTSTALGHSTNPRQNAKAVGIGVAGRKIFELVMTRRKPASPISATAKGSGASTSSLSQEAYRWCSGASCRCA